MLPELRGLLLDLDGTVVDTLPLLCEAFRAAVAPWVHAPPDDAAIVATFGPPERENLAQLLRNSAFARSDALAHLDEAVERFLLHYERCHARILPFPGMAEATVEAERMGWKLGVFTGKGRRPAEFTVQSLGLADRLAALVSGSDVARSKPDPEGVLLAARQMRLAPAEILFVGDSPADVVAGAAAGARTAGALWGAFDPAATRAARPDFVLDDVGQLRELLRR